VRGRWPVAGGLAPPAWADDTDTQFLADIDGIGVPESPAQLIASARMMCHLYSEGESEDQVNLSVIAARPHWSEGQSVSAVTNGEHCWRTYIRWRTYI
jgi:hypothetical protein